MRYFEKYLVDGRPLLLPDADVEMTFTDLDHSDSGRDESGYMHRILVRERVGSWGFQYSWLTAEEYAYLRGLFAGKQTFTFRYQDADGGWKSCRAYCADHSITYRDARLGLYKNLKFHIIEC